MIAEPELGRWSLGSERPNPNLCPIRRQNRTLFEVPLRKDVLRVRDANSDFWAMLLLSCTAITGGMHGKEDQV